MEQEITGEEFSMFILLNSLRVIKESLQNNQILYEDQDITSKNNISVLALCIDILLNNARLLKLNSKKSYEIDLCNGDIVFSADLPLPVEIIKSMKSHDDSKKGKKSSAYSNRIKKLDQIPYEFRLKLYIMLVNIAAFIAYNIEMDKSKYSGLSFEKMQFNLLLALFGNEFRQRISKLSTNEELSQYFLNRLCEYNDICKISKPIKGINQPVEGAGFIKFIYHEVNALKDNSARLKFEHILLRMHEWFIKIDDEFIKLLWQMDLNQKPSVGSSQRKLEEYNRKNEPYLGYYNLLIFSLIRTINVSSFVAGKQELETAGKQELETAGKQESKKNELIDFLTNKKNII